MDDKLSSNIEDYLETIIMLSQKYRIVRVRDISKYMEVSMPSANSALKILKAKGLINQEKYGYVELTGRGHDIGKKIYDTHKFLINFLNKILDINITIAEEDACRMEHILSKETLKKLMSFAGFIESDKEAKKMLSKFKNIIRSK